MGCGGFRVFVSVYPSPYLICIIRDGPFSSGWALSRLPHQLGDLPLGNES